VNIITGNYSRCDLILRLEEMAVLVIDVQNDFLHPEGVFVKHGIIVNHLASKLEYIVKLITICRNCRIPIIYVKHSIPEDKVGHAINPGLFVSNTRPFLLKEGLRLGTWGIEMLCELGKGDVEIEKQRLSGFFGTHLESYLRYAGITTLVFCGFSTNICVEHTFRDGVIMDFRCIGVKEAMIAHDPQLQEASQKNMEILGHCLSLNDFESAICRAAEGAQDKGKI
jgi:ureidoacrylate peracid hydrolase